MLHEFESGVTNTRPSCEYCTCIHCGLSANMAARLLGPKCGICPRTYEPTLKLVLKACASIYGLFAVETEVEALAWQETLCGPQTGQFIFIGRDKDRDGDLVIRPAEKVLKRINTHGANGVWIPEQGAPIVWWPKGISHNDFSSRFLNHNVLIPYEPTNGQLEIGGVRGWCFKLPNPAK